jgi:hypothetical protein
VVLLPSDDETTEAMLEQWERSSVQYMDELTEQCLSSDDIDEVARLFASIERATQHHKRRHADARAHLLAVMQGHNLKLHDSPVGRIEVKGSKARKSWKWDDLIPAIVAKVKDNRLLRDSGEVEAPEATAARLLRECVGMSYGKVTGLRKYGLDADEYCEGDGEIVYTVNVVLSDAGEPW